MKKKEYLKKIYIKFIKLIVFVVFIALILIYYFTLPHFKIIISNKNISQQLGNFYIENDNSVPENYEREILDKIKFKFKGYFLIPIKELYFINGLIRKYKPKKILEIGVCSGGVSATILNAIKDIDNAKLYSCDLEKNHYTHNNYEVGYVAKNYFPDLLGKWKLYTGNTTAAFIEEIGGNIDFVFIDTAHVMPGEVLNIIEILPFLKRNAIISFDDIHHHTRIHTTYLKYFHSCNNLLMSVLRGKKIIFEQRKNSNKFDYKKLGAVILDDKQENFFFEYFYLLTNNWSYMPNKFEIYTIRNLVKKYYKPFFLSIFDKAVEMNYYKLKKQGLLDKDYILYTFTNYNRSKSKF